MVWENGTSIVVMSAVCRSWTWHLSAFVSGWGHLISFSTCLHGFGWSLFTSHLLFSLSSWPLIFWCQILPNPLSCHRYVQEKLTSTKFQPSSNSHLILIHENIMFLCLTSMTWETLWPTFDQAHFLSTSAHYPGSWSRDSLLVPWSLHASMAGSSHSMWGCHHWPPIEWFCGFSMSAHCSHAIDCTCSTLRTIGINGGTSRVC